MILGLIIGLIVGVIVGAIYSVWVKKELAAAKAEIDRLRGYGGN